MLGNRIRELRKKANLTQKGLADKLRISEQSVAHYESNRRSPDPYMLKKIANFFDVTIDYLTGNDLSKEMIKQQEENQELLKNIADDLQDPTMKALYSKASELKNERDKKMVLNVIQGFMDDVDENEF